MIDEGVRRQGIGCSQIAAVQGLSAFATPWEVAYEKRGLLVRPQDEEAQDWLRWGSDVEPAILAWYARSQKKSLTLDHRTRKHPELPLVYTPDALVENERRGVDAKCVGWAFADEWRHDEPPADAWWQAHGYMLCMDLDEYDLVASICGAVPRIFTVRRDAEVDAVIKRRIPNFWNRFVVGEEEMPIDGSQTASAWLQWKFPRHRKDSIRKANEEQTELLEEYETCRIVQDEVKARRAELENQLKLAIGNDEGLVWPGGQFTWRTTKDRSITDWQSMAIGLRNEYVKEPEKLELLESLYTREKKGERRIHFKSLMFKESKEQAA